MLGLSPVLLQPPPEVKVLTRPVQTALQLALMLVRHSTGVLSHELPGIQKRALRLTLLTL